MAGKSFCTACGKSIDERAEICPKCGVRQHSRRATGNKSRVTAGLLGILLGGIGAHKFYLENTGMGILYLIFCWTFIPAIIGFIEGIMYLTMDEKEFHAKYG